MTDGERFDNLEADLYSAFPATLTTGVRVWMVNLRSGNDIVHGEGPTLRAATDEAIRLKKEGS